MLSYVWTIVAYQIAIVAIAIGFWALCMDTPRGRRRCRRCWYEMTTIEGRTCPECGHTPRYEDGMYRVRRHWGRFSVSALLMVLALGIGGLGSNGLLRVAPTWLLVTQYRSLDNHGQNWVDTVWDRVRKESTGDWQRRRLVQRIIDTLNDTNTSVADWLRASDDIVMIERAGILYGPDDPRRAIDRVTCREVDIDGLRRAMRTGLRRADPGVRAAAAKMVASLHPEGHHGRGRSPFGTLYADLLPLLASEDPSTRGLAGAAIRAIEPMSHVVALGQNTGHPAMSIDLLNYGGLADDPSRLRNQLVAHIRHEDADVGMLALLGMYAMEIPPGDVMDVALHSLEHADPEHRRVAIDIIARWMIEGRAEKDAGFAVIGLADHEFAVHYAARQAVERIFDAGAAEGIFVRFVNDDAAPPAQRGQVLRHIQWTRTPPVEAASLIVASLLSESGALRDGAGESLAKAPYLRGTVSRSLTERFLESTDRLERLAAADALAALREIDLPDNLHVAARSMAMDSDTDAALRLGCVRLLRAMGDHESAREAVAQMSRDGPGS